jgi:hypothetical protein
MWKAQKMDGAGMRNCKGSYNKGKALQAVLSGGGEGRYEVGPLFRIPTHARRRICFNPISSFCREVKELKREYPYHQASTPGSVSSVSASTAEEIDITFKIWGGEGIELSLHNRDTSFREE